MSIWNTCWETFNRTEALVGDLGASFVNLGYSGMGFLISRYAGIEQTVMFSVDAPEELEATVAVLNEGHAWAFEVAARGPCEVLFATDNLSSDVQSPPWFRHYSAAHYLRIAQIAHAHGKLVTMHIDGRLRGLLHELAQCQIDGADAVTPAPWGDLTPQQCRDEAGSQLILSGGIPPHSFDPSVPLKVFDQQVDDWLALRGRSGGLIIAPGDQLPPSGSLERVSRMVQAASRALCT
jgi:uroporphyrinogen-III decarboxylase